MVTFETTLAAAGGEGSVFFRGAFAGEDFFMAAAEELVVVVEEEEGEEEVLLLAFLGAVEEEPEPKRLAKGLEESSGGLGVFTGVVVGGRAGGAIFLTSGAGANRLLKGDPAGSFFSVAFAAEAGETGAAAIDFVTVGTLARKFKAADLLAIAALAVADAPAAAGGTLFFNSFSGAKRPPNEKLPDASFFFSGALAATGMAVTGVLDAEGPAVGNFKAGLAASAVELVTAGAAGFLATSFSGEKRPPNEKPPDASFFFSGALAAGTGALAAAGPALGNLRAGVTAGLDETEEERGDEDDLGFAALLLLLLLLLLMLLGSMGLPPIFKDTAGLDGAAAGTDFTTEDKEAVPVEEDLDAGEEGASPVIVAISVEGARVMLSTVSETATWIPSTVVVTELLIAVAVRPGIAAISSAVACALRLAA